MSHTHMSNNLDKIIQLISIEQVRCLMKQMKIDDNSFSESEATKSESETTKSETIEQLNKINNTLLLIVDKISAIETEIKIMKETKQQKVDDEEHIKLQIEEKVIVSTVEILEDEQVEDEDKELESTSKITVEEKVISLAEILEAEEEVVNLEAEEPEEEAVVREAEE